MVLHVTVRRTAEADLIRDAVARNLASPGQQARVEIVGTAERDRARRLGPAPDRSVRQRAAGKLLAVAESIRCVARTPSTGAALLPVYREQLLRLERYRLCRSPGRRIADLPLPGRPSGRLAPSAAVPRLPARALPRVAGPRAASTGHLGRARADCRILPAPPPLRQARSQPAAAAQRRRRAGSAVLHRRRLRPASDPPGDDRPGPPRSQLSRRTFLVPL